ncbi:MAG: hypothetical protein K0S65_981 [Labilithrix sp.]|nr:hypothetical protein [Labilithrix sp.]
MRELAPAVMFTSCETSRETRRGASRSLKVLLLAAATAIVASACAVPVEEDEESGETSSELRCSAAAATKVANVASKMEGRRSGGYCYRHVKAHLRAAGMPTGDLEAKGYGGSAYKFSVWAKKYPSALAEMGLTKVTASLDALPKGALIVWPRGMCGYNKTHGHIEVVVDNNSSRACSDFCGRIKKGCGTPDIYVPKGCTNAAPDEADDDDTSDQAPAEEGDASSSSDEAGGCWSATLDAEVAPLSCVKSKSNGVWMQCKDGKWYRGVAGSTGPYGACNGTHSG